MFIFENRTLGRGMVPFNKLARWVQAQGARGFGVLEIKPNKILKGNLNLVNIE